MQRPRILLALVPAFAVFFCCRPAAAAPLVVDGNLSDWGFTVADNNKSKFVPSNDYQLIGMMTEDTDDKAPNSAFLGPYWGGQNYDAEMMAVALQGNSLFIAIVGGQRPDNGFVDYAPGDLVIYTSGSMYGVEIGGGAGGGTGSALTTGMPGSTYTLNSDGDTTSHKAAPTLQTVGSVWQDPAWIYITQPVQMRTQAGGTLVGSAELYFTRNTVTTQHSIIEMSIPLSLFGGDAIESIIWRPSCENDELIVGGMSLVPEPSSAALALLAVAVMWPVLRRQRRA